MQKIKLEINQVRTHNMAARILVLNGITPADLRGIPLVKQHVDIQVEPERFRWDNIPDRFVSVESWPTSTNLLCWECDLPFSGYPKFIPTDVEDAHSTKTCRTIGNFCRWSCAAAHVGRVIPEHYRPGVLLMMTYFESKFTGNRRYKIFPSPPKTTMMQYCGPTGITREEWNVKANSAEAYRLSPT